MPDKLPHATALVLYGLVSGLDNHGLRNGATKYLPAICPLAYASLVLGTGGQWHLAFGNCSRRVYSV
ncbi:hypothetical protein CEXT_810831 [Caerostris extrusa]|uniref:Uncharacterized protein n=1 Tax=Caerostris extrusa TaxID=172846 RepID=A0AAV4XJH8_CAEEX|nr:hypothetical protein CEXT_810831 [Caerostris extrusa]